MSEIFIDNPLPNAQLDIEMIPVVPMDVEITSVMPIEVQVGASTLDIHPDAVWVRDGQAEISSFVSQVIKPELDAFSSAEQADMMMLSEQEQEAFKMLSDNKTALFQEITEKEMQTFETLVDDKTQAFSTLATSETTDFKTLTENETTDFKALAENKTIDFISLSDDKTTAFNQNATDKGKAFDDNATSKIQEFTLFSDAQTDAFEELSATATADFKTLTVEKTQAFEILSNNKVQTFSALVDNQTQMFETLTEDKTQDFISLSDDKITVFNQNATDKGKSFNDNATIKTQAFTVLAEDKTQAFETLAEDKTQAFETLSVNSQQNMEQAVDMAEKWAVGTLEEQPAGSACYWAGQAKAAVVDNASETTAGIARLATADEVAIGTDDTTMMTPLKTAQVYAKKETTLAGYGITDAYTQTQTNTLLNAKANTSASNFSNTGKQALSALSMPSTTKYTDLTLGASGTIYTAPATGWFVVDKSANNQEYLYIGNNSGISFTLSSSGTQALCASIPVQKGMVVSISYNASRQTNRFRFVYAKGAEA